MRQQLKLCGFTFLMAIGFSGATAQGFKGYYQHPDIHQNTIVFVAEGDIWKVPIQGGLAQRLTTHTEEEQHPRISPDGKTLLYSASYEGPREVYTMPLEGGLPTRWTYSAGSKAVGWTPKGEIIYQTSEFGKLPYGQLVTIDPASKVKSILPLLHGDQGIQNQIGTWFFVPLDDANDNIQRYKGGWARQIWKFDGKNEAVKITTGHMGESFNPMWFEGRIYFITDRDGMKNIWSMNVDGKDLKQHTTHTEFDVRMANLNEGKIVYKHAADLWLLDIASGKNEIIDIRLASDLAHLRETWIENPEPYITAVNPDSTGDNVAVTARGRVFVIPVKSGRTIKFTEQKSTVVRYRDAVFSPDGKNIIALSDQSGEFEFVQFAANGLDKVKPITKDKHGLRYQGIPSSDGKWLAVDDIEKNMYVINVSTGERKKISTNQQGIQDFAWSPDNQWLAFVQKAFNGMWQIKVYNLNDGSIFDLTTDRSNNFSVKWSPDGAFVYYLSDRDIKTLVGSARGVRLGGVYWDKSISLYHVALKKGAKSPFREKDELSNDIAKRENPKGKLVVNIDKDDILSRTMRVPIAAGNYSQFELNNNAIFLLSSEKGSKTNSHLKGLKITSEKAELTDMASEINGFKLTLDGEKLLIVKGGSYYMVNAGVESVNLNDGKIDLSVCKFSLNPRDDWKQIYKDAWRMERDYFYDKNMHGVDWDAMYDKYLPLVDRVTTRNELNDILARLIGELSVLHASADGGDIPDDAKNIQVASLGANTSRDVVNGGFRIDYIYKADPDYPSRKSPIDDPYLDIREGDVITKVNGKEALTAMSIGELLRNQADKQVRLTLKRGTIIRDVIVKPDGDVFWLKYGDWEYANRLKVENASNNQIGYLHLSAMDDWDIGQFYREFYPVSNRKGLIIDLRYNAGGWIDAIILEKLLRQVWNYFKERTGEPYFNMDYAFRGHMVLLVNERTGSNGETFAEGFRRLGLGKTIGMRTWGGQVWINGANSLSDNGVALAPFLGSYGSDSKWLIEGHGHVPDMEVDNLPNETFKGKDAQLDAAIKYLQEKIAKDPRDVPPVPAYPDKSFKNNKKN
ncbi:MAG: protease [Bacteroidetes bacterium]|nr:MAG: protease [Bacteroidota bacterium]